MKYSTQIFLIVTLLFFSYCQQQSEQGYNVVMHESSEPDGLHPAYGSSSSHLEILRYIHYPLLRIDIETGNLQAVLASSLPLISEDGLVYSYEIHPEASWTDGTPITADDVLFSFKFNLSSLSPPDAATAYFDFFKDITPDPNDPQRFTIEMTEVYILNDYLVTEIPIVDKRFFDPDGYMDNYTLAEVLDSDTKFSDEIISWAEKIYDASYGREIDLLKGGAGPYKVESWETDQQIVLSKKENFWASDLEEPVYGQHPERIIFKFIQDQQSLELEIKQQAIDVSTSLGSEVYERLQENEIAQTHFNFYETPVMSPAMILLNTRPDGIQRKAIFNDLAVRKALAHIIPVDDIIDQFYLGGASRTASMIAPSHPDYFSDLEPINNDPQIANDILEEANWLDADSDGIREKTVGNEVIPLSFSIIYPNSPRNNDIVDRIKVELSAVGIEMVANPVDIPQLIEAIMGKNFDAALLALSHAFTPYDFKQIWHSSQWPEGQNFTGYSNPEVDSLIDLARITLDKERRKILTDKIQQNFAEELPAIPLFSPTARTILHKKFENGVIYPFGSHVRLNDLQIASNN